MPTDGDEAVISAQGQGHSEKRNGSIYCRFHFAENRAVPVSEEISSGFQTHV
jgi:hypothetical protein